MFRGVLISGQTRCDIVYIVFLVLKWLSNLEFRLLKKEDQDARIGVMGGGLEIRAMPERKRFFSLTPSLPIQIDYPVHAFRLELSEVRMDGHSGWMRLWFLTVVGQNMHDWPKKSHSFALNCGWSQFGLALINGSLARVLHREGDNAVRWIRALAWI